MCEHGEKSSEQVCGICWAEPTPTLIALLGWGE